MRYLGIKIVDATPMTKATADEAGFRTPRAMPSDGDGYQIKYSDGYVSWSPKGVFERDNRKITGLPAMIAFEVAKSKGSRIAREGWNGKNMWAVHRPGDTISAEHIDKIKSLNEETKAALIATGNDLVFREHFLLYTAQGDLAAWAPSVSDSLANDWYILD